MATPIGSSSNEQHLITRYSPRWGENDGKEQVSDGLSRFRNNFSACQQVPVEGGKAEFDGFMIPKPNNVDSSKIGQTKTYRTSSWDRAARFEVFPKNNPTRRDDKGDFVLEQKTREALGNFHKSLFCTSRYGMLYPDTRESADDSLLPDDPVDAEPLYDVRGAKRVRFADDFGYNLEIKPTCRADLEMIANPEKWPRFDDKEPELDLCSYRRNPHEWDGHFIEARKNEEEKNINQNYHMLMASIYNYRLPSALHLPDDCFQTDTFPEPKHQEEEEEEGTKNSIHTPHMRFQRPTYPASLIGEMHTAKQEMKLMDEKVKPITRTIPNLTCPSMPLIEDDWTKSSCIEKLKLPDKSGFQKRYHQEHPDSVPDLRDHTTYSKKVFFQGFNSTAFRG